MLILCCWPLAGQCIETRPDVDLANRWRLFLSEQSASPPARSFPFGECFEASAREHDLPVTLLLAVARGESDFDPEARSNANALGLMQIRWPVTARHLGIEEQTGLYDPCTNVDAGARYLKELLARELKEDR